ncbi:PREDICTED: CD97 antigen [Elephantulus edwardii]|uniref:CD97 antigen n=1 Tax=Elephantulus edwardii TaxID=28737 RepID=UPI0003F05E5E|nr:PREDICTED: CD97 antigen [Elephantulus edwardii]
MPKAPGWDGAPGGTHGWEEQRETGLCLLLPLLGTRSFDGKGDVSGKDCAICPMNAECVNATTCRCKEGFKSINDFFDTWETCEDENECFYLESTFCGVNAECYNLEGSYSCLCSQGYELATGGRMFNSESENTCQDVDECLQNPRLCKSRGACINTNGSYTCQCPLGFEFKPQDPKVCADVNECSLEQKPCHSTTHCLNTVGSYECRCRRGWKPKPGSPNGPNTTVCEERQLDKWTWPLGVVSQSLTHFFEKVTALRENYKPNLAKDTIQKLITFLDELLGDLRDLSALDLPTRHRIATQMLMDLEGALRTLAQAMPGTSFTYRSPGNTELSLMIQEKKNVDADVTVGQSHARMRLSWAVAAQVGEDSGPTVVGLLSSQKMQQLLDGASLDLEPPDTAQLEETPKLRVDGSRLTVLSAINSVFLSNKNTEKLESNVTFSFAYPVSPQARPEKLKRGQKLICAFWKGDSDLGGHWATTGCWTLGSGNGSTTCQCNHLSSFAILMTQHSGEESKLLALITKVGLSLSLVCLLLCVITFLLVRSIQSSRTTLHLNLCICLFVGSAIFLAGIENDSEEVGLRCRLVAGLLHYFFLAAFCWMALQGLELYYLVVRVFQGQGLSTPWLCLIGYGVPGVIVGISAAVNSQGYGRPGYCWLDQERYFLWSFLGPVAVVILCNSVIFVVTVWKLTQKFGEINPDLKKLRKARILTISAVAQLFVLGSTWVFGLFLFDPSNQVLSYIFTILNCLQGLFLFVLHCLLNKKVRTEYRKWLCVVTRSKYSEFTSTSQNQTRTLRQSESGM